MALTTTDANDINTVLRYMQKLQNGGTTDDDDVRVREIAERLAAKVNKTLLCGVTPKQIREEWPA